MMLTIAFLMFAVLIAGWLFAPEKGTVAEAPSAAKPEAATSQA